MKYALVSSSRNEEKYITLTLESVTKQSQLPERWIIVDDGSVDRTGEIADERHAGKIKFVGAGYARSPNHDAVIGRVRRHPENRAIVPMNKTAAQSINAGRSIGLADKRRSTPINRQAIMA